MEVTRRTASNLLVVLDLHWAIWLRHWHLDWPNLLVGALLGGLLAWIGNFSFSWLVHQRHFRRGTYVCSLHAHFEENPFELGPGHHRIDGGYLVLHNSSPEAFRDIYVEEPVTPGEHLTGAPIAHLPPGAEHRVTISPRLWMELTNALLAARTDGLGASPTDAVIKLQVTDSHDRIWHWTPATQMLAGPGPSRWEYLRRRLGGRVRGE